MEQQKKNIDWVLLIFLLLFTNQAIFSVKILGLVLVYLLRPNLKFGLNKGRMPLFIPILLMLSSINFVFFTRDFSSEYLVAFIAGNLLWVFSFLSFHQVKFSIERYGTGTAHRTLKAFIILHFLFCIGQLVRIMFITGRMNPYDIALDFPYGMSAGDNVFGVLLENSLYNVTISTFLTIYFIFKKNWLHAILASLCAVLVFSNFGTIIFVFVLACMLATGIFNSLSGNRVEWIKRLSPPGNFVLYIPMFWILVMVTYVTVSPENTSYLVDKVKAKIFSIEVSGKNNYARMIADQSIDTNAFTMSSSELMAQKLVQYKEEDAGYFSTVIEKADKVEGIKKVDIMRQMTNSYVLKLQGKTLAVLETKEYLRSSPVKLMFGAGTTRFSSHIAQKMAGFDSSRLFMNILPKFRSQEYEENHMLLIEERIKSKKEYYSTANFPDSFYNQIFGEYGLLGALSFLLFYIGYFARKAKMLTYGFWLFLVLLPFAHLSYIFDTMCVMPFFELLMLIDIQKEETA